MALMMCFAGLSWGQDKIIANHNEVITGEKKGNIEVYISKNSGEYKVGDTISIGMCENDKFIFVMQNTLSDTLSLSNPENCIKIYNKSLPLTYVASDKKVVIKSLVIFGKTVKCITTNPEGFFLSLYIKDLEAAINNKEIKAKFLSSEDALAELKKAKDKLDLGLITQEEYDAKKEELSKYIK